jgi:hypothetical protein
VDTKNTDQTTGRIAARLIELRAERDAFAAGAEAQAQARLEAVRQGLMVEIQVRMEMYERMIGELERLNVQTLERSEAAP